MNQLRLVCAITLPSRNFLVKVWNIATYLCHWGGHANCIAVLVLAKLPRPRSFLHCSVHSRAALVFPRDGNSAEAKMGLIPDSVDRVRFQFSQTTGDTKIQ